MALPVTLDATKPAGSRNLSLGDDDIREFKQQLLDIFGLPSTPAAISGEIFSVTTGGAMTMSTAKLKDVDTTAPSTNQEYANKKYVDDQVATIVSPIPATTLMLFQQTAAPTGWTKQSTHNNKGLRVVSGAASSGGASAFTSVFGSGKNAGATTLTTAQMPVHSHPQNIDAVGGGSAAMVETTGSGITGSSAAVSLSNVNRPRVNTDSVGSSNSHTHTLSLDLQYVDVIICSKD